MALDIADGQIQGIRSIVNPDKLGHLGEVADASALLRGEVPRKPIFAGVRGREPPVSS